MKESEAWVILAEEFDGKRCGDNAYLCNALVFADQNDLLATIPVDIQKAMTRRIESALDPHYTCAYHDMQPDTHPSRVLACLLFSAIAEDEGD